MGEPHLPGAASSQGREGELEWCADANLQPIVNKIITAASERPPTLSKFQLRRKERASAAVFHQSLQPYESVIWAIKTLHFTPPQHPSSISILGTN